VTILVTGGGGVMGQALREFLPDALYLGREACDVRDDRQLNGVFQKYQPELVIHAAALTNHQHPDAGEIIATNVIGTERVARYCRAFNSKIVYLSTHYVYPGETGNYKETDETRPIGTYAWSKLAGEGWAQIVPDFLIIRGSWYTKEKLQSWASAVVADAYCSRIQVNWAAEKIATLVNAGASGTYNIGGPRCSFVEILGAHSLSFKTIPREELSKSLPYPFPPDTSVNTDRYDALVST
jgi:dTDP-4-dehydrorhamnose reductase